MGLFGRLQGEINAREISPGLSMSDILAMPETLGRLVNWMMRQGQVDLPGVAGFLGQDENAANKTLKSLIAKGFVRELDIRGSTFYRIRLAPKRARKSTSDIWKALEDKAPE